MLAILHFKSTDKPSCISGWVTIGRVKSGQLMYWLVDKMFLVEFQLVKMMSAEILVSQRSINEPQPSTLTQWP